MSDYFAVDVVALSNFEWRRDEFDQNVNDLRTRFDLYTENSLFKFVNQAEKIPIEQLPELLENIWKLVREDKEINLPDLKKVIIARFRCSAERKAALNLANEEIKTQNLES